MPVMIDLDKSREIKFGFRACRDLETAMGGKPLADIIQDISRIGMNAIVLALWAGLKHEDRAVTPNLVEKYLETFVANGGTLPDIARLLDQAFDETNLFKVREGNS